jgi:hypothetical protein
MLYPNNPKDLVNAPYVAGKSGLRKSLMLLRLKLRFGINYFIRWRIEAIEKTMARFKGEKA